MYVYNYYLLQAYFCKLGYISTICNPFLMSCGKSIDFGAMASLKRKIQLALVITWLEVKRVPKQEGNLCPQPKIATILSKAK